MIALDAGHVCQNLYLACEAIGARPSPWPPTISSSWTGWWAWTGRDEFVIYLAPVGKV